METKRKRHAAVITGALCLFIAQMPAQADSVLFNFNSLASGAPASGGVGPNGSIQNYMNNLLGCNCVTVTGAVADRTYNGEGYVTGPGNGSTSLTLGTSDGAAASNTNSVLNSGLDTFIATTNDSSHNISSQIVMTFTGYVINGTVSFDYEAFPDNTGAPDFEFVAKDSLHNTVASWAVIGVTPGASGGTIDGTAVHSPNHQGTGLTNLETNKQYIGTWSGNVVNATELDFIDWPATIAIDNLSISRVPEPGTFLLLGTALGLCLLRNKIQKA